MSVQLPCDLAGKATPLTQSEQAVASRAQTAATAAERGLAAHLQVAQRYDVRGKRRVESAVKPALRTWGRATHAWASGSGTRTTSWKTSCSTSP